MSHQVKGILKQVFDIKMPKADFYVREFVITTDGHTPYPQHVTFKLINDKVHDVDFFNIGDELVVNFNLRGKFGAKPTNGGNHLPFNSLEAWRVKSSSAE